MAASSTEGTAAWRRLTEAVGRARTVAPEASVELADELLHPASAPAASQLSAAGLGRWLAAQAGDGDRREALVDLLSLVVRELADGDDAPADAAGLASWQALTVAAAQLHPAGPAVPVPGLPFLTTTAGQALAEEARVQLAAAAPAAGRRPTAPPGPLLARLVVSRQLCEYLSELIGVPVRSTRQARYLQDVPGSHVRPHLDARGFPLVFHLVLEHDGGTPGSALAVHVPGTETIQRTYVAPGTGVLLWARGTIHAWEALAGSERRNLIAAGFTQCV